MSAASGLLEMYGQYSEREWPLPKQVFLSGCTASGAAGLVLASVALSSAPGSPRCRYHTTQTYPGDLRSWMWWLLVWTRLKYGLRKGIRLADIKIHLKHAEVPYGKHNAELLTICERSRVHGLNIDPITARVFWSAMENFIEPKTLLMG